MQDLEAKTVIAAELTDLLKILNMLEGQELLEVSVTLNGDKDLSFDIEDPMLFNLIKDYVKKKAKMLDANFKLTTF